jgi:hypothetical protein
MINDFGSPIEQKKETSPDALFINIMQQMKIPEGMKISELTFANLEKK